MTGPLDATPALPAPAAKPAVKPIRREITVVAPVETAFAMFTAHIGRWWPLATYSVNGAGSLVAFEGDRLVERWGTEHSVWAEVISWDPPTGFRLSWHPGSSSDTATDIEITFTEHAEGTLVTLVHSGWERTQAPVKAMASYSQGWMSVLGEYGSSLAGPVDRDPGETSPAEPASADDVGDWYALVHTPGPAMSPGESVFSHPRFSDHLEFLERLRDRGLLVAAGPVFPERGEGMTVVRLGRADGDVDLEELARTDDASVSDGYLQVEVRPWSVRLTG